jgi:hypothetical protein
MFFFHEVGQALGKIYAPGPYAQQYQVWVIWEIVMKMGCQ